MVMTSALSRRAGRLVTFAQGPIMPFENPLRLFRTPQAGSSGWSTPTTWTARLMVSALLAFGLGAMALVAWTDTAKLTNTPLCGPSCLDPVVAAGLVASDVEFPAKWAPAESAARFQVSISPFDTGAWIRIAALNIRRGGGKLTPAAIEALLTSYERAPIDARVSAWRIPLVFSYWTAAPPALRKAAQNEVVVLYKAPENRPSLWRFLNGVHSYEGRFAYQLLIDGLDTQTYRELGLETPKPMPNINAQMPAIAGN